ncbi:nitronate monooxygenase [Bacillus haynesii]|uniref:nitronate monooxygenase n=1 Tax=Bacillus haynesii TaxID=1925021 RepID=UPI00227F4722|nr:nitronate monooxygenase [Bacillus haynesii]MCY7967666.1 nitronate monooxygenase [Bacillus haynesii]MCY8390059.1 nitronate monooxygenase [Bacillus haynesii]MCY8540748.1 nitronate monooxygenase [Bacillus haynesii]MCY8591712.1 nitronate monooxygenase [Bacillus haynesii]MCY8613595.1 nitronate monooxygenase [Bacillus haynesii]
MNQFMERLSLSKPVVQAPMAGGPTTPRLAAAVSECGGLGSLASGYLTPEVLQQQILETKKLTSAGFQVNLFIPEKRETVTREEYERWQEKIPLARSASPVTDEKQEWDDFYEKIEIILKEGISAVSFTFGPPPADAVKELKNRNCCLMGTAVSVEEAVLLEELGMDVIIVQGSEAGGHRGAFLKTKGEPAVGSMALIPQAADHVSAPVIAAGGIFDKRGVAAAFALGAQGVQIGTAFLTCEESGTHPAYKQKLLEAVETDTSLTRLFSGKPARGIVNQWMEDRRPDEAEALPYPLQNTLTQPMRKQAKLEGNTDCMSLWSGQGVRASVQQTTVKELMDQLVPADVLSDHLY